MNKIPDQETTSKYILALDPNRFTVFCDNRCGLNFHDGISGGIDRYHTTTQLKKPCGHQADLDIQETYRIRVCLIVDVALLRVSSVIPQSTEEGSHHECNREH
jgi:hypothetical protein